MSSSTFKYLDQSNGQGSDAAQDFLNKKMAGNKYMSVSNPDNPYSMGEGTTPDGTAYPGSKASIAAASNMGRNIRATSLLRLPGSSARVTA